MLFQFFEQIYDHQNFLDRNAGASCVFTWWYIMLACLKFCWRNVIETKELAQQKCKCEFLHTFEKFSLISLYSFYHFMQEQIRRMNTLILIENKASRRTQCILRDALSFWIGQHFARLEHMSVSEQQRLTELEWQNMYSSWVSFLNHTSCQHWLSILLGKIRIKES